MKASKKIPTDLEILNAIFDKHYDFFSAFTEDEPNRRSKVYVPVDIKSLADEVGIDPDVIFGRLYYHLNNRYSYGEVKFFVKSVGPDINCINFPYMSSVLADLRAENSKYWTATTLSIISVVVSVIALVVSLVAIAK